jgi:hypothetical protein
LLGIAEFSLRLKLGKPKLKRMPMFLLKRAKKLKMSERGELAASVTI